VASKIEHELTLARNLAPAFIATQHGIGLEYARKKHSDQAADEPWISLARTAIDHVAKHPALPPRTLNTIQ
jgi:hypothetical protein